MADLSEVAKAFDVDDTTTDDTDTDVDTTTNTDDTDTSDNDADDTDTDDKDSDKDSDKGGDKAGDKGDKDAKDDDEGYFADEDDDDTDAGTDDAKDKDADLPAAPSSFSAEDKYIIDNLPLITVRVVGADDKIKTMQVRSAADLPRDMKGIATPYEDKQFDLANAAQETRARELQTYYRQNQAQISQRDFEAKENQSIREDVAELQRDGEIPKFKAQPGTRAFNDDPAAKIVQETIEFMNERNAKYLERSNAGGAYRHIGFAEAFELRGKANVSDKNSDTRKDAANKLKSRQGGDTSKGPKAPVSGRTLAEVAAEFEEGEG
jgi:hypothetical protein